jgi:hypothetical protein
MARRVAGLALVHTTHTNPLRSTKMATLYTVYTALEKPVMPGRRDQHHDLSRAKTP